MTVTLDELIINIEERGRQADLYLARGWAVLPVHAGKKTPATRRGVKDAVTAADPSGATNWKPDAGNWLAVATGTGTCVLDVDVKDGKKGLEAIERLQAAGLLDHALGIVATPSGGRHFYFPAAGDEKSRSNGAWGLDWQCAGKYVVAPPSPGYRWLEWTGTGEPLAWDDVCDVLGIRKPKRNENGRVAQQVSPVALAFDLAEWLQAQTFNRNQSLFWAASRVAELPNAKDADFDLLRSASLATSKPGEDREDEVNRTIASARNQEQ